jgi:hypothetical protein
MQAPPAFGAPRLYHESGRHNGHVGGPNSVNIAAQGWALAVGEERGPATGTAMGGGWAARAAAETAGRRDAAGEAAAAGSRVGRSGRGSGVESGMVAATPVVGVNAAEPPTVTTMDGPASPAGVGVDMDRGLASRRLHAVVSKSTAALVTSSRARRRAERGSFLALSGCSHRVDIGPSVALLVAYVCKRRGGAREGR